MSDHSESKGVRLALILGAAVAFSSLEAHAATVVDTCGQEVGGLGVLTADLDCTGFPDDALTLRPGASLDLAGFTLTGGLANGVICEGGCTVFSSAVAKGVIQNAGIRGIRTRQGVDSNHVITVANLIVTGNGSSGVTAGSCCFTGNVVVLDSEIVNNGGTGVSAIKKTVVRRSNISGNASAGVGGCIVAIADSTVDGNGAYGVGSCGLGFRATNTSASHNGSYGFLVGRDDGGVRFRDCDASSNALDGIHFDRLEGVGPTISGGTFNGNGRDGVRFDDARFMIDVRAKIIGADISGNVANGIFIGPDEPIERITLKRVTLDGNGAAGITGAFRDRGIDASASTITGNGTFGVHTVPPTSTSTSSCLVKIGSSSVTGNGVDLDCGVAISCADVGTCEMPSIAATTVCGTSYDTTSGFPGTSWGVCSAD